LQIGLSYDYIAHASAHELNLYINLHREQMKDKAIERDTLAWNIGQYVMVGVGVVLSNAFAPQENAKYPDEPVLAVELDEKRKEAKRKAELQAIFNNFSMLSTAVYQNTHKDGVNNG